MAPDVLVQNRSELYSLDSPQSSQDGEGFRHNELRSMRRAISRRIDRALNFAASRAARGGGLPCGIRYVDELDVGQSIRREAGCHSGSESSADVRMGRMVWQGGSRGMPVRFGHGRRPVGAAENRLRPDSVSESSEQCLQSFEL